MGVVFLLSLLLFINLIVLFRHAKGAAKVIPLCATFLSLLALLGPSIWDWARPAGGVGLIGFWALSQQEIAEFRSIMLFYTCGASFGNIYLINMENVDRQNLVNLQKDTRSKLFLVLCLIFLFYLIGQGTSIVYSDLYLNTNGIGLVQRIASALLLPGIGISLYLVASSKTRREMVLAMSFHAVWSLCILGTGSRVAVISIGGLFVVLVARLRRKYLRDSLIVILGIIVTSIFFNVSQSARSEPLGVARLPKLVADQIQLFFTSGLQYLLDALQLVTASLLTCVPVIANSSQYSTFGLLLKNFNPIIGAGTSSAIFSSDYAERLYPYVWVPLATAGQLYGGLGPTGALLFVGILSLMAGRLLSRSSTSTTGTLIKLLSGGSFAALMLLGIQYSSRMWLRLSWSIIILWIVSYFINSMWESNKIRGSQFGGVLSSERSDGHSSAVPY